MAKAKVKVKKKSTKKSVKAKTTAKKNQSGKYVYFFGAGKADGKAKMKELLGGKGANLAEMTSLGIPVPAGFTITTEVCDLYYKNNRKYPAGLKEQVEKCIAKVEKAMDAKFGDAKNPLLVSVRSGAAVSMPGMMDTILNLGINEKVVQALTQKSGSERFAWDSYRRFIQMFSSVAMGVHMEHFEERLEALKKRKGTDKDTDLSAADLKGLVSEYKAVYQKHKGEVFPDDPKKQLWGAITAVFGSWNNPRAIKYRQINDIRGLLGTAVNVQSMVFGNMGDSSATGVCFSRNPATGENKFYGEFLINAQGEDVVAGIRTPQKMSLEESREWAKTNDIAETVRKKQFPSLQELMPACYKQLVKIRAKLETHYKDMQDMEFTIQDEKLYMLQTRNGKRTGHAAVNIAVEMVKEKLINEKVALTRIDPGALEQLLHPTFTKGQDRQVIARGLNASPGAAVGKVVFSADDAVAVAEKGDPVILVRIETSPEDIGGMHAAKGILTSRGGATSHAAVVARQMGKCCVAGCGEISINYAAKQFSSRGTTIREGEYISLDGTTGEVMAGKMLTEDPALTGNFGKLMSWADKYAKLSVRTNADTPVDARRAIEFGAKGIGLCRTEHMFFEGDRIDSVRKMILADDEAGRRSALSEIEPLQRGDFIGIFKEMKGYPVIIRLLDPPLHEFLPHEERDQVALAQQMGVSAQKVKDKVNSLHEFNPMLGFRGCRLSVVFPEIMEMQVRAIVDAALTVKKQKLKVVPEIMIPLVGHHRELGMLTDRVREIIKERIKAAGVKIPIMVGTMIEVPRAALTADEIAQHAEFFSFGTNDLTQMTCGFSRDDAGSFLGTYVEKGIYDYEPFQVLDQTGVGQLMEIAIKKGRMTNKKIEIGICGEHGGEPHTIKFCHRAGLDYVSCSPFRVPVARLVAAQAAIS